MDPVAEQVDAYNARDMERFLNCYAEDVVILDGRGTVLVRGSDEMRAEFTRLFDAAPALHADVLSRLEVGGYVILEERIEGYGGEALRGVMVYHLREDVIDRCIWLT
jgi:hypothetical protein